MQIATLYRAVGVCVGIVIALYGFGQLLRIVQAGMMGDAYFYYLSYRYGLGKDGVMTALVAVTVLGIGIVFLSLRRRR